MGYIAGGCVAGVSFEAIRLTARQPALSLFVPKTRKGSDDEVAVFRQKVSVFKVSGTAFLTPDMVANLSRKKVCRSHRSMGFLLSICHRVFGSRRGRLLRRLITLICAGWIPHDLVSSWSCLYLKAGVSAARPIPTGVPRVLQTATAPLPKHSMVIFDL